MHRPLLRQLLKIAAGLEFGQHLQGIILGLQHNAAEAEGAVSMSPMVVLFSLLLGDDNLASHRPISVEVEEEGALVLGYLSPEPRIIPNVHSACFH